MASEPRISDKNPHFGKNRLPSTILASGNFVTAVLYPAIDAETSGSRDKRLSAELVSTHERPDHDAWLDGINQLVSQ
jgi:hypothetical protein